MTYRTKVILLISFATILLMMYLAGGIINPSSQTVVTPEPWLSDVPMSTIEKLGFSKKNYSLVRKENDIWNIIIEGEEFPAKNKKVEAFIKELSKLAYYSRAGNTKENWSNFSVEESADKLQLYTEGNREAIMTILFGSALQGSDHQYARKESEDKTYVIDDMQHYINTDSSYWSDLSLFPENISIQDVISFEYEVIEEEKHEDGNDKRKYRFQRETDGNNQGQWVLLQNRDETIDQDTMNRLVRNVIEISGERFARRQERGNSGITNPRYICRFETEHGDTFEMRVGKETSDKQIYVKPRNSQYTFLVSEWRMNTILNPLEELIFLVS